jgi:ankyrin repeat protein/Flp pilus assembly protein TadD
MLSWSCLTPRALCRARPQQGVLLLLLLAACLPCPAQVTPAKAPQAESLPVDSPEKIFRTVHDLLGNGDQAGAEMLLGLTIPQNPGDQRLAFFEMACIRSRFNLEDAAPWIQRTVKLDPTTPEGLCANLVGCLDAREHVAENLNALQLLVAANPDNLLLRWMLAVQCRAFDRDMEGIRHYRVLCRQLKKPPVLVNQTYGNLLDEACLFPEALVYRRAAVEQERQNWSLHALGMTLTKMGRYEEAAAVMAENAEQWRACGTIAGLALLRLNRPAEALAALAKAEEHDPDELWTLTYKGRALKELGRYAEAADAYAKAYYASPKRGHLRGYAIELFTMAHSFEAARALQKSSAKTIDYERAPAPERLMRAAESGDLAKVRTLLEKGASVESAAQGGAQPTALMRAAQNGWDEIVDLLLARGAKVDAQDKDMATALNYAVRYHQTHCLQKLLKAGANINLPNKWGQTPLCEAASVINPVAVRLLLDKGADPNIPSQYGAPLIYAVHADDGDDTEIAEMLHKAGARLNDPAPNDGATPLMGASDNMRWKHFVQLIEWKADLNRRDKAGRTALMYALMSEGRSTYKQAWMQARARLLVEHGAKVNVEDNCGQTALDFAARVGATELVDYLRQHGVQRTTPRFPSWQFSTNVTSEIRQRAVAATTPLLAWEGGEFGCIGGMEKRRDVNIKFQLNENWSLKDEGEFRMRLAQLRQQCDSADYALLPQMGPEDIKASAARDPAQCVRATVVQCERAAAGVRAKMPEGDALMAWDLVRYMHLCGIGMAVNYLQADEGWQRIEEAEARLEKRFASWDEVAASFRLGQKIYDAKDTPDYDEIFKLLNRRDDPNHPWKRVAWNTGPAKASAISGATSTTTRVPLHHE